MERRILGVAPCFVRETYRKDAMGLVKSLTGFVEEGATLQLHKSMPSRRISYMIGDAGSRQLPAG